MSRVSRIPHPPGSRFVSIHHWAVREVGLTGAAVLGFMEFLDRAQEEEGQVVASRIRIIAELQGIASKNTIDRALTDLLFRGWLIRHERTVAYRKNFVTWIEFSLAACEIEKFLASRFLASQNWDARNPNFGPEIGTPVNNKEIDLKPLKPPPSRTGGGGGSISEEEAQKRLAAALFAAQKKRYRDQKQKNLGKKAQSKVSVRQIQ